MSNGKSGGDNPLDRDPLHGDQGRQATTQSAAGASGAHSDIPTQHADVPIPHTDMNTVGIHQDIPGQHADATVVPHADETAPHSDASTAGGTQTP